MDKMLHDKLLSLDWRSILTELLAYANARKNYTGLEHLASPNDLVNEAVSRVLSGERVWDPEKHPDIVIHLKNVIKSLASHAWESAKAARRRDEELVRKIDSESAYTKPSQLDTEAHYESLLDEIENELQDDEELLLLYYAMTEGYLKDKELAAELDLDIVAIRNAKKRLRRRLTAVKRRFG